MMFVLHHLKDILELLMEPGNSKEALILHMYLSFTGTDH